MIKQISLALVGATLVTSCVSKKVFTDLESDYAKIFDEQFNSQEMLFAPYTANPSELMDSNWYMFSPGSLLKKVADDLVPDDETGGDIVIPNPGDGGEEL